MFAVLVFLTMLELIEMAKNTIREEGITPIPLDRINPLTKEFRRMDSDGDERVSFTEFLLADTRYIEKQSTKFHKLDENGDGLVSLPEYEAFYKRVDDNRRRKAKDRERFFDSVELERLERTPFFREYHVYRDRPDRSGERTHQRTRPNHSTRSRSH
ncbi:unnamed protein product [Cylicocyclus nassatus]|uniref:EF-hand domain-containing protein n=1 Tax=Cylicocyclus nassatus TaxID=53992 RepID=A0AA36H5I1_CYLNA|nr:unnamed protein product [Cylicocyclus nassatus]